MRKVCPKGPLKTAVLLAISLALLLPAAVTHNPSLAAPEEIFFTILHTNDEHAALVPSPLVDDHPTENNPSLGGFARLAGTVKEIRAAKEAEGETVLLLSAGDYMGGSAFSWLSLHGQAPELSLLLELGYDAVTIGNHEYDYGPELLAQYLATAGYPAASESTVIVASNTRLPAGHPLTTMGLQETWIKEVDGGLKIGFLGLMGKAAAQVATNAAPVEFYDQYEAATKAVNKLKAEGAHIIVAITHSGEDEDILLARAVPDLDIIVGGHNHTALTEPLMEGKTIIVQAGELLQYLGILELAWQPAAGTLRVRNGETGRPHLLPLDYRVKAEPGMASQVAAYAESLNALIRGLTGQRIQGIADTVAYTAFTLPNSPPMQESPLGNFVADAMRLTAQEALGEKVDFAVQFNGSIRGPIVPGSMPYSQDRVSFYDLVDLVGLGSGPDGQPGYPLISVYLTGEEVRRIMEVSILLSDLMGDTYYMQMSGMRMEYDPNRAILFWVPVKNVPLPSTRAVLTAERYTGEGIQGGDQYVPLKRGDEALYHLVTDSYIASFLPMVGEMLPSLGLVPKDREGNPLDIEDAIIYRDGQELKVWQTVVEYAAGQPLDNDGHPRIPEYYNQEVSRILQVKSIPLLLWPAMAFIILLALLVLFLRHRRKARFLHSGAQVRH